MHKCYDCGVEHERKYKLCESCAYKRKIYRNNRPPEKCQKDTEYHKAWKARNPEKVKQYKKDYSRRKRLDPAFRHREVLRGKEYKQRRKARLVQLEETKDLKSLQ